MSDKVLQSAQKLQLQKSWIRTDCDIEEGAAVDADVDPVKCKSADARDLCEEPDGAGGDELCGLLEEVDDPEELVLEALEEFHGAADSETSKSRVVLLEEFARVRERAVEGKVREEAMRLAVEWRGKLRVDDSWEVLGFLHLLIAFGLGGQFDSDEILKLFYRLLMPEEGPDWLSALGLADKVYKIIQKLIKEDKRLEAVRYIFAFELVNDFPQI
ncbi:hypothetical protein ACOSQ2_015142 [Xanthoceras sorbifolium]